MTRVRERLVAWWRDDTSQFMLGTVMAAGFVSWWIRRSGERLIALEKRWPDGKVPLDDLVTTRELARATQVLRDELDERLAAALGPDEAGGS